MTKRIKKSIVLGGTGSGNWAHAGRPGMRGGSVSTSAVPRFQVGITSARPEKTKGQVALEMNDFKALLGGTPVSDLSVSLGIGGWEGGSEPTYITQYTGNGEAKRALAHFAQKHNQDAVLIQKYVSKDTEGAQPQNRVSFDSDIDEPAMREIEKSLVARGFGGWTWGKQGNNAMLMLTCIPQWGGDANEHRASFASLMNDLRNAGLSFSGTERPVLVDIMERDDYAQVIEG